MRYRRRLFWGLLVFGGLIVVASAVSALAFPIHPPSVTDLNNYYEFADSPQYAVLAGPRENQNRCPGPPVIPPDVPVRPFPGHQQGFAPSTPGVPAHPGAGVSVGGGGGVPGGGGGAGGPSAGAIRSEIKAVLKVLGF